MTQTEAPRYFVTSFGSHRHADRECANQRRDITSAVLELASEEVANWTPCEVCTTPAEQAAARVAADAKTAAQCPNPGVTKPQRLNSNCRACNKPGKVNRRTGKIAPHAPLAN